MKWKQRSHFPNQVSDDTGRSVCSASTEELAAQIVKDHNSQETSSGWSKEQIDAMHDEKSNEQC